MIDLLEEGEDVTALAAAEAVPHAPTGSDVETGAALVMERAQALHRAAAGALERDVLAHDVVDLGPLTDFRDVLIANPAGHGLILGGG